jgi:hypothetical protein
MSRRCRSQLGQATSEYVGLVLLVATLLAGLVTLAGPSLPGGQLARAVASKVVCAVKSAGSCGEAASELAAQPSPLQRAYGGALAEIVGERLPTISFEDDEFASLPVDYRECRERTCADSIRHGSLEHTQTGLDPTVFVHVVDCRDSETAAADGFDCTGARAGNLYLQYWLYYPDSATRGYGRFGFHRDDWESYQVRIAPDGTVTARASSHHGYHGRDGDPLNDAGALDVAKSAWDTTLGQLHVAAGSHAGTTEADPGDSRRLEPQNVRLLPLEPIVAGGGDPPFAVSPPWEKGVWTDPEATGT